ncbi:MAG: response regulator [Bacteroidales bacterium]|nr:response regulator [Bacteroidales bacterium]
MEKLLQIFNQGPVLIFKWKNENGKWNIEFTTDNVFEYGGLTKEEVYQSGFIKKFIHPDDYVRVERELKDAVKNNVSQFTHLPYRVVSKDRKVFWVKDYKNIIKTSSGEVDYLIGYLVDITEQIKVQHELERTKEIVLENQHRLSSFINTIPDIVCYKNAKGEWLLANEADLELFCLKDVDYFGKTDAQLADYTHEIYREAFMACMESDEIAWNKGVINQGIEVIPTVKGDEKIYDVFKIPTFHSNGERKALAVIGRDITDLIRTQEELKKAKEKAEQSDLLKSAFLANMSHEIRTPMNAIVGFASFLGDPDTSADEIQKYSEIIINSGNHLLNLINDIIDISRLDAGTVRLNIEIVDTNKLIDEFFIDFSNQIKVSTKNITLKAVKSLDNCLVKTDETRLKQILVNLLGNALKFTEEGSIEFGYVLSEKNQSPFLSFYVKDTGIGIHKDKKNVVFERFRQANVQVEKFYGGTGLGLSIASACVELLNGDIWLESELNKGSVFYFDIPYDSIDLNLYKKSIKVEDQFSFDGENVLIVEDDQSSADLMETILKKNNLNTFHAKNGIEALDFVKTNKNIEIVLMDLQLPELDGIEATREIKNIRPELPVIVQTAFVFENDKIECFNAGADEYLTKPINSNIMLSLISKYINKELIFL